jgi:hypothetical protein
MITDGALERWHDWASKHRTGTAFHEAAHVVAADHFGMPFDTVSVLSKYTTWGYAMVGHTFHRLRAQ